MYTKITQVSCCHLFRSTDYHMARSKPVNMSGSVIGTLRVLWRLY